MSLMLTKAFLELIKIGKILDETKSKLCGALRKCILDAQNFDQFLKIFFQFYFFPQLYKICYGIYLKSIPSKRISTFISG